jgi:hypothetical protein
MGSIIAALVLYIVFQREKSEYDKEIGSLLSQKNELWRRIESSLHEDAQDADKEPPIAK